MRMIIIGLTLGLVLSACGTKKKKSELQFFKVQKADFASYLNSGTAPEKPNLNEARVIFNNDYPIEIALFEDGSWYYNLDNLGDGRGSWTYQHGHIKLHAERALFDMNIVLRAVKKGATKVAIEFADRFGPKELIMERSNP